ncbi:stage III sporulation protein AA [Cytobacillus purgationiresistens]|uniref:Stage III sporulation protein AA n=1 Tax=Cytobacillus purgationiresistens TaxID=863449 RepID=A0ABU0AG67_9BACI|nr:stage III sporulation protein AA [Cytobacillus purgationiresistens]MDQ0269403.1 stage III sporulation protein AA [Cytobacillus purgationiresistens]
MEPILTFLPKSITEVIMQLPSRQLSSLEEIRVRINRPLEIADKGKYVLLPYVVTADDAIHLLNKISHFSIYTLEEELRRGYITIEGGHRVGLAGKVILEEGKVKAIRDVSSFNIRIAKEKIGIAEKLVPNIYRGDWLHTMIIGAPQTGKTTLLRDIARIVSTGDEHHHFPAKKVGIVDERSEIAGSVGGIPQMTFGARVDVLDSCPKAEGMMMMIRSMSPEILVVDELGSKEDVEAVMEAVNAGIKLITTTHGYSYADIKKRPILEPLLNLGIFERFVELNRRAGPGSVQAIRNADGKEVLQQVRVP